MANIGAYSRHKMLDELNSPLFTNLGTGATPLVLTPAEQKAIAMANLTDGLSDAQLGVVLAGLQQASGLPTGAAITTSATTALGYHYKTSPVSGVISLDLTDFVIGTSADGASLGIGASLISFPTDTLVNGVAMVGDAVLADDGMDTVAIEVGLGTTVASGAVSVLGGTATFESLLGGTASAAGVGSGSSPGITTFAVLSPTAGTVKVNVSEGIVLRTTTPGLVVFFNAAAAWNAALEDVAELTFTGQVVVNYVTLG